mgnify:CR=1 FL=1
MNLRKRERLISRQKASFITFILAFTLFCFTFVSCTHKQIPFDKNKWLKEKNRYYMADSLIEKLTAEKPKRSEIFDLLGKPKLEGRISENEVDYWLKSEGFLTIWVLSVQFDDDGNFKSAIVYCED